MFNPAYHIVVDIFTALACLLLHGTSISELHHAMVFLCQIHLFFLLQGRLSIPTSSHALSQTQADQASTQHSALQIAPSSSGL